jgi:hypothetical protein
MQRKTKTPYAERGVMVKLIMGPLSEFVGLKVSGRMSACATLLFKSNLACGSPEWQPTEKRPPLRACLTVLY